MKAALLVCLLAATALAAPRYPRASKLDPALSQHVRAAEQAWSAAESEQDPAKQPALWEAAAAAFALVDDDPVGPTVKRAAALAEVLAWRNAIGDDRSAKIDHKDGSLDPPTPRPVPAREQRLLAAIEHYIARATDPSDTELPDMLYLKASTLTRFDQLEAAAVIYRDIIKRFPQNPVAVYSANLALDAYNRLQQYDAMLALADELAANKTILHGRDELTQTVKRLQRAGKRKRAEALEKTAKETKDFETYVAAGTAYLDIYNADPDQDVGDELLYNAGVSFEEGAAMSSAIQAFTLIQQRYAKSPLAARALARLGKLYGDIAMYDRAAETLEKYAKTYAGQKDAFDAMSDAVYFRKAIGDRAKAIEDTRYFAKAFGARRPREAAMAVWSLTPLYESTPDELVTHLREYIKMYGLKGGVGPLVAAHAKLGLLLWKQSCPVAGVGGLCVKAAAAAPRTCGKGTVPTLTAIVRDAKKSREALAELRAAVKEFERQPGDDDGSSRYFYAQAKLAMADVELERYLALVFPTKLDFDPANRTMREASMKRFETWLGEKTKVASTAMRQYEAILATKDAASSIDATERIAMVTKTLSATLLTAPIPPSSAAADKRAAYCDVMTTAAEPLAARSLEAYGVCLAKSVELSWFSDASRRCETELIRTKPDAYPPSTELRARPAYDAAVIASEPPVRAR